MLYTNDSEHPTKNVPTSKAERAAFVLSDEEILALSRWACVIERHYGQPMDIEWAKDGQTNEMFIVQARPETVQSRREASAVKTYHIRKKGRQLLAGVSVGEAVASGRVCVIENPSEMGRFIDGAILVTRTTDPDWVPIMRRASAIVTDHGGRTSHAAIVSRELGLPAIVATTRATHLLHNEQEVTVCCAKGREGFVYEGIADYEVEDIDFDSIPTTRTKVMLNLANPAAAFRWWRLPADGVGLARGLGRIAAVQYPHPVVVRMSDFKTNEYANLIGGAEFEPKEENPMLGFRGASRYYSPRYREGFALECRAIRRLREEMGFRNVVVMIPFCRSAKEADRVLEVMAENGIRRGEAGLEVYVMCEIPSNVILAKAFAQRFDGFSIGSNDLTQLTLGVDRDSAELAELFDEQDEAVRWMIQNVITQAHRVGADVGLCGQAPSDQPEFAGFLVECGIDSMSVSPDSFIAVKRRVATAEETVLSDLAE
ncbi:Phosphoenolpyruvate synthase [Paraburkholderia domus]|nr:Phosphoenolpyruvate synthase [Paraburkholderia domus]